MKSKVIINVTGAAGTGKSTVAEVLLAMLNAIGFKVTHEPMEETIPKTPIQILDRLEAVKDNTEIVIREAHIRSSNYD